MDFNAGFWISASKMLSLIGTFEEDDVKFLALKWNDSDGKEYYSILFSPCGYVVIELITNIVVDS